MIHQDFARDRAKSPRFIFVGRLVQEKGFDRVVAVAKDFLDHPSRGNTLEIYWPGYHPALHELVGRPGFADIASGDLITAGTRVVYHGQVSPNRVAEALQWAHYMLMPSRFLETFGLSALESIIAGVPVIGYAKGGMKQFLLSEHSIVPSEHDDSELSDNQDTEQFLKTVTRVCEFFSGADWKRQSLTVQDIAARTTPDMWISAMREILPERAKILMVNDYSAPLGGIETHILAITDVLRANGYQVESIASQFGTSKFLRYLGLLFSWCNIGFAIRFFWKLKSYEPNVVWLHSDMRAIGPVGLLPLLFSNVKACKTYHDLGYFGAYATDFVSEKQLQVRAGFWGFFSISRGALRWLLFHIYAKYLQVQALWYFFKRLSLHIVPSEFMKPIVVERFWDAESVLILPHFSPHASHGAVR